MKQLLLCLAIVLIVVTSFAQKANDSFPYQKYPSLPAFKLLMLDSSTIFNTYSIEKGKPTILIYFSPDCDHCKTFTDSLLANIDDFKNVNIFMFTPMALSLLREFYIKKNLKNYKNIVVGKEYELFFPRFYGAYYVPFIVVYDKHKKLIRSYEGGAKIPDLIKLIQ